MKCSPLRFLVALVIPLGGAAQEPTLAVTGFDPVELCGGREVAGAQRLSVDHGRYRYRFASAENRATFEAALSRYEVQLGGGCGHMGPLSGVGDPQRRRGTL